MAEAQEKSRLKRAIKRQSQKIQSYTCSSRDKVLVWHEKKMNNHIGEFIGSLTVLHNERSKIVAIDQNGFIKR